VGEGLVALAKAGVAPRTALDVINASSGRSFVSEVLVPERVLTRTWPRAFRLALLDKDVAIAVGLLAETGVAGPVFELTRSVLGRARAALGEAADYLDPIRLTEQQAGVELRG
jgi:3-hydroxyisobutyrate dehydrogenase